MSIPYKYNVQRAAVARTPQSTERPVHALGEDAWVVLRYGRIFDPPEEDTRSGEWKYRVEGHEPGGKWIAVVFSFKSVTRANLITIFSVKAKGKRQ